MLDFECPLCGETVERPKTDEEGYQIHHDHSSLFCDEHTEAEVWDYIQSHMDGGGE